MKTRNISALTVSRLAFFTPGMIKDQRLRLRMVRAFFVGAFAITLLLTASNVFAFTFTTIDVPGATGTGAARSNAVGQIVGGYTDASGMGHGFLLDKGTFTTIDPPGSVFTQAIGINAAGRIVGDFELPGQHHGFLLDKGTFTLIDFPGPSTGTDALGINAAGQVVGRYVAGGTEHGFLLDKGTFTTVDPPGSTFTEAIGINAAGQIVGDYTDASGTGHGFVATP